MFFLIHGRSERHLTHLGSPFIVPFPQKAMGKRRSNRVKQLKCETNRSVVDILWQPLVNTSKETHILLMDVENPAPEVVSRTWFTNFRKKWVVGQVLSINCSSNSGRCWVWIFLIRHGSQVFLSAKALLPSRRRLTLLGLMQRDHN